MEPVIIDINGDGLKDIVVPNKVSGTVSISFGSPTRSFANTLTLPGSPGAQAADVADIDGDGDLDIVATRFDGSGLLSIYDNLGNTTFSAPRAIPAGGTSSIYLRLRDVTGDSLIDIVMSTPDALVVRAGAGNGTFGAPVSIPQASFTSAVNVADMDGDGLLDVVAVSGSDFVYVRSLGAGQFAAAQSVATGQYLPGLAVGDFNADGRSDVAVAGTELKVVLGTASATGMTASTVAGSRETAAVTLADVNSDGNLDIVSAENNTPDAFRVFQNDGTGNFSLAAAQPFLAVSALDVYWARSLDLDGDETIDLITSSDTVNIFFGGSLTRNVPRPAGLVRNVNLTVGDFNGDGLDDLVTDSNLSDGRLRLWLGSATNPLGASTAQLPNVGSLSRRAVGDFDEDGDVDLFAASGSGAASTFLANNGTGAFTAASTTAVSFSLSSLGSSLSAADVDGDGHLDVLILTSASGLHYLRGNGNGTFSGSLTPIDVGTGSVFSTAVADLNGDGRTDLAASVSTASASSIVIRYRLADGSLGPILSIPVTGIAGQLTVADLNDDGRLDLVVARTVSSSSQAASSGISVLVQQADGSLGAAVGYAVPLVAASPGPKVNAVDVDGDGDLDLLTSRPYIFESTRGMQVLLNDGSAGFGELREFAVRGTASTILVGDFNGDHRPDAVMSDFRTGLIGLSPNLLPADGNAPVSSSIVFDRANGRSISFNFDEPLDASTVQPGDLVIRHLPTGQTFAPSAVSTTNWGKTLRFTLPAGLPDGDYEFRINAGAVTDRFGNALASAATYAGPNAFLLAGDANRDRRVNFDDLLVLASNYNQSGRTFGQGDFNDSGTVDFDDLLILAARYNTGLPGVLASRVPPPAPRAGPAVLPDDDADGGVDVLA